MRVLSYNIHKGRAFLSRRKTWKLIEDLLHAVEPDIAFLQEFLREPEAERLLEGMADRMWPHHSFGRNATAGDFHYGNVIISKFPLKRSFNTDISNHALEKRGLLYAEVEPEGARPLHLFCTHLDLSEIGRKRQVYKIEKTIRSLVSSDEDFLLVGDFNDWNRKLDPLIKEKLQVEEAFFSLTGRPLLTSPSLYPMFPLDRLYFRGLKAVNGEVFGHRRFRLSSDHLPLVVEFARPE
jgi:endonuclease/exonuclease/phosphatase family metal-dependent hydrolase